MLCRKKYPYTAAWHIFNTGFPVTAQRRHLMSREEAEKKVLILTAYTGTMSEWAHQLDHSPVTIARMVEIYATGGVFGIEKPEIYAKDIYELTTHHLQQWVEQRNGFVRRKVDNITQDELVVMDAFAEDILTIAKHYGVTRAKLADDPFMASLRSTIDSVGLVTGRILTSEKIITDFKHNPFAVAFRGV